jgi:hypothetical protein
MILHKIQININIGIYKMSYLSHEIKAKLKLDICPIFFIRQSNVCC